MNLTPCKAIREYCLISCNAKKCENNQCPLFPYHLGHNPSRKGVYPRSIFTQSRKNGKIKPTAVGEKRIRLIGLAKDGKLTVVLPNGDSFIYEVRKEK